MIASVSIADDGGWDYLVAIATRLTGARCELRIIGPAGSAQAEIHPVAGGATAVPLRCDRAAAELILSYPNGREAAPAGADLTLLTDLGSNMLRLVTEVSALRFEHSEQKHRTDNEIQLWLGMLAWQERNTVSKAGRDALTLAQMRLGSIAAARRAIDRSAGRLGAMVRGVCEAFMHYTDGLGHMLAVEIEDAADLELPGCATIALILNELLTNALKHAFAPGQSGAIRVQLRMSADVLRLSVSDDGTPFRPRSAGTGLQLIQRMVADAGASLNFEAAEKRFAIVIPVPRTIT